MATVGGEPVARPSLLPIPGELAEQNPVAIRLRRLGKIGRGLLDQPATANDSAATGDLPGDSTDEHRLLFDYLRGDYAAASADVEILESRAGSEDLRFRLLSLRRRPCKHKARRTGRGRSSST